MANLTDFLTSITEKIAAANKQLLDANTALLKNYFEVIITQTQNGAIALAYDPKTVTFSFNKPGIDGKPEEVKLDVPIADLVPLKFDTVKISGRFAMSMVNDEIQLNLIENDISSSADNQKVIDLELSYSPQLPIAEVLSMILKKQEDVKAQINSK